LFRGRKEGQCSLFIMSKGKKQEHKSLVQTEARPHRTVQTMKRSLATLQIYTMSLWS
jgi:hypothetical protein